MKPGGHADIGRTGSRANVWTTNVQAGFREIPRIARTHDFTVVFGPWHSWPGNPMSAATQERLDAWERYGRRCRASMSYSDRLPRLAHTVSHGGRPVQLVCCGNCVISEIGTAKSVIVDSKPPKPVRQHLLDLFSRSRRDKNRGNHISLSDLSSPRVIPASNHEENCVPENR